MGGGKVAYHQQMRRQYNNDECDLNNNSLIDYFFQWKNLNNQLSSFLQYETKFQVDFFENSFFKRV